MRSKLAWLGVIVLIALAALAYAQPAVMIQVSNMIWSCFG